MRGVIIPVEREHSFSVHVEPEYARSSTDLSRRTECLGKFFVNRLKSQNHPDINFWACSHD